MSVLIEGISVVIRKQTLEDKFLGGVRAYRELCPNGTYCADSDLTRVGFMMPQDVQFFVGKLMMHGLDFGSDAGTEDICVLDQLRGPTIPCSWLEFEVQENGTSHCWLKGNQAGTMASPLGWKPGCVGYTDLTDEKFGALGNEDGLDFIRDQDGKKYYIGRPFNSGTTENLSELRRKANDPDARWEVGELLGGTWPSTKY